jgi:hypothetical protein
MYYRLMYPQIHFVTHKLSGIVRMWVMALCAQYSVSLRMCGACTYVVRQPLLGAVMDPPGGNGAVCFVRRCKTYVRMWVQ